MKEYVKSRRVRNVGLLTAIETYDSSPLVIRDCL